MHNTISLSNSFTSSSSTTFKSLCNILYLTMASTSETMASTSETIFSDKIKFYVCGHCGKHIPKNDDWFLVEHFGEDPVMYFHNGFNLIEDSESNYRTEGEKVVADVQCSTCKTFLGYRIVRLAPGVNQLILHTREVPVGTFVLYIFEILKWNKVTFVCADEH